MSKSILFWSARLPRHSAAATARARPRFGRVRRVAPGRRRRHAAPLQTGGYTRGNDLSGSLEGAGGIGGLLERADGYNPTNGTWTNHNYYHADGNGNITYMESNSQTLAASYRYDAFGNTLASSGTLASSNTYRFSSKEFIPTAGLYYYLYHFYDPVLQRWVSRDPAEEEGNINLYEYTINDPIDYIDTDGSGWFSFIGFTTGAQKSNGLNKTAVTDKQNLYDSASDPDASPDDLNKKMAKCKNSTNAALKNAGSTAIKGGQLPGTLLGGTTPKITPR